MYSVKDLCGWYGCGYKRMRKVLLKTGVISQDDHGRGNRERLGLAQLEPLFRVYGMPKNLTLQLPLFPK